MLYLKRIISKDKKDRAHTIDSTFKNLNTELEEGKKYNIKILTDLAKLKDAISKVKERIVSVIFDSITTEDLMLTLNLH